MNQKCKHKNVEYWQSFNTNGEKSSEVTFCTDCGTNVKILSFVGAFHSNPIRTWKKKEKGEA